MAMVKRTIAGSVAAHQQREELVKSTRATVVIGLDCRSQVEEARKQIRYFDNLYRDQVFQLKRLAAQLCPGGNIDQQFSAVKRALQPDGDRLSSDVEAFIWGALQDRGE